MKNKRFYRRKKRLFGPKLNKRQKKEVKAMIEKPVEIKYRLTNQANVGVGSAGLISVLTSIPQGLSDTNRTGDTLHITDIRSKVQLTIDSATSGALPAFWRMTVIQWHPTIDTAGASPALTTIFQSGASGAVDPTSQFNHDQRHNFKVLWDRRGVLIPPGAFAATTEVWNSALCKVIDIHISKHKYNKTVQYIAGSTTNAANQIFAYFFTNQASTFSAIAFSAIIEYTDS